MSLFAEINALNKKGTGGTQMISSSNYIYGTAARKIEYVSLSQSPKKKKKIQHKINSKYRFKVLLTILFLFALCMVTMVRYAFITELNYKMEGYNKKYKVIREENSRLRVKNESNMDLESIKEIAENNLGMQKPESYQKVYVKVTKSDFTKVAKNVDDNSGIKEGIFASVD